MKYQVISKDYNGTTIILQTSDDLTSAINKIKSEVTNLNFENALTTVDKFKSIEAFFPVVVTKNGQEIPNIVYAGKTPGGDHVAYIFKPGKDPEIRAIDAGSSVLFYIGKNENKDHYMENSKKEIISSFEHEGLWEKTHYYIKVLTK